jgi:ABC-type lipoprotein export system ATPase subunit
MEEIRREIESLPRGAEFVRADLHIHSFGDRGSYDVSDAAMTPNAIVDAAVSEGLGVIAITDHNEIRNVEVAIAAAAQRGLLVVPGVELSTPHGHLLAYAPTFRDLEQFFGKLTISKDRKTCSQTMEQCLELVGEYGGFGIAAHVDLTTGLEAMMPRFDAFKEAVITHPNLFGLEISKVLPLSGSGGAIGGSPASWYTERDDSANRKRLHSLRAKRHGEDDTYEIPRIVGSDAHSLAALGKNASGARKLTRVKIDVPTFDSLRVAFLDPVARVRIEDLIPVDIPHFVGMSLSGGFLDGQAVRFSRNLTCIIGGRGTGKSTLLESLRAVSGNVARESLLDSDVWPDQIFMLYRDQAGREHVLGKSKFYDVINHTDPAGGITQTPIESYGQGETAETIQHCDKDPSILLGFLDDFIDLRVLKAEDESLREQLLANQTQIERLRLEANVLPEMQKAKLHAEGQLKTLKEQNAASIVELEEKLARGRKFKKELVDQLNGLFKTYREALADTRLGDLVAGLNGSELVVGQEEFGRVKNLIDGYVQTIRGLAGNVQKASKDTIDAVNLELNQWTTREAEVQNKIDTIRRELEGKGVKLDLAYIRKVTKDVTDFTSRVNELIAKQGLLSKTVESRRELVQLRRQLRSRIAITRNAFATQLNENLRSTIVDYFVDVRFHEGVLSREAENIIKDAMGWRTSQVPRASLIASQLPPLRLIEAISKLETKIFTDIKDHDGNAVFSHADARAIFTTLNQEPVRHSLERCQFEDRPEITVTKEVEGPKGKQYLRRDFSKLSLGQQQSVLLSILLFSKSNEPLVIDQPEDNLDSEFIYKTFVKSLRHVKETRQVIVVTHNANIAVLGDAELIIPLRASSEKSVIRNRGSIDNADTKDLACTILEGSKEAFKKRQRMYGH